MINGGAASPNDSGGARSNGGVRNDGGGATPNDTLICDNPQELHILSLVIIE